MDPPAISSPAVVFPKEGDLSDRLRRRDPIAMARLYDLYGTIVFRLVFRVVRDQGAAEDIVQETFGRVWEHAEHIREGAAVGPWIMTIARNRALDHIRLSDVRMAAAAKPVDSIELCMPGQSAEARAMDQQAARRLRAACNQLNPNQRRVIEMAYYQGLTQSQIAETLNEPLGTVKSWTRSALEILRQSLAERGNG